MNDRNALVPPITGTCTPQLAAQLLSGDTRPLGVPVVFFCELLTRARVMHHTEGATQSLRDEYEQARGYAAAWGQLIEMDTEGVLQWRVVPVRIWSMQLMSRDGAPLDIVADLEHTRPVLHRLLEDLVPTWLALEPPAATRDHAPHAAFCLRLIDPAMERFARDWMATELIDGVLPLILEELQRHCGHGDMPS